MHDKSELYKIKYIFDYIVLYRNSLKPFDYTKASKHTLKYH